MTFITAPNFPIKAITWTLDQPGQANVSSWAGTRVVVANPWHGKWSAQVDLATQQGDDAFRIYRSFLTRCRGELNTFRLPATVGPQNTNSGVSLSANASAGATSISISGASTPLTDGQYFTLNGQLCVCTADQSGSVLTFLPPLRQSATSGTTVVTSRPYALVSLSDSKFTYGIGASRQFALSFSVDEAILETDGAAPESGLPILSSPTASASGSNAANLSASTDTPNGIFYWTVDTSPTTPTEAQVKAGLTATGSAATAHGSQAVSSTGTQNASASGLASGTTYYAHFAQESSVLIASAAISSPSFTTAGVAAPTGTATMTQLASAKRVYQRSTLTGGGQGKGTGTIPVTISSATAGTLNARCSSGGGTRGDLQAEFLGATITNGATTANIAGVDARLGWFYLDIKDSTGTWQNGTVLVGMGRVIAASGQSLMVRMFKTQDTSQTSVTLASLSLTPNANGSVCASYGDNISYSTTAMPAWAIPADSSNYDSAGCVEYLNREIPAGGVNCAFVGHSAGGQAIAQFLTGGTQVTQLRSVLDGVGGFEAFVWFHGHSDAANGMAQATYESNLDTLFADITAHNAVRGSSYEKHIITMPNIGNDSWGTADQRNAIRAAGRHWASLNSAVSVEMMDIAMNSDGISGTHQTQVGSITIGRHLYRASRTGTALGLAHNDNGPTFTASLNVDQKTITLTPTFPNGGSALSAVGTPSRRFSFSTKGGFGRMPLASFTVNSGNIVAVLSTAIAVNNPLDISIDHENTTPISTGNDASVDMIYDNVTDGESGMTTGRSIGLTFASPIQIAATTPSLGPTLTAGGTALYAAGASGFGNCLDGSGGFYAKGATTGLGDDGVPYSNVRTIECRFKISATPGSTVVLFSGAGAWVGITSAGKFTGTAGDGTSVSGTATISTGAWHHVRLVCTEGGSKLYLDGTQDWSGPPINIFSLSTATFAIGALGTGGGFQFPGLIDEFATFTAALNTGSFTPPSAPYVGNEANLYALYHLNSALTSG